MSLDKTELSWFGNNMVKFFYVVSVFLLLAACSSPAPVFSPEQISEAHSQGRLSVLYDQLKLNFSQRDPSSQQAIELRALMDQIGIILSQELVQKVEADLSAQTLDGGRYTVVGLKKALDDLAPMEHWNATQYSELLNTYSAHLQVTQAGIEKRIKLLDQLSDDKAVMKAQLLAEVSAMYGGRDGAKYSLQRDAYIEDLYLRGLGAVDAKDYDNARVLLNKVNDIQLGYKDVNEQLLHISVGQFEKNFWDALGAGNPDKAYQLFYDLSQSSGFSLVKYQITHIESDISNYFNALGKKEKESGDLGAAYQAFKRARYIRAQLEAENISSAEESQFIKTIEFRFNRALKAGRHYYAMAYLCVLDVFDPSHTLVKRNKRTLKEKIMEQAAIKLSPEPFVDVAEDKTYGRGLSAKISQYLLQELPEDIRIIERKQFDVQLAKLHSPGSTDYLSHYYLQGEILESQVDSSEQENNQTRRVVTAYDWQENAEYLQWEQLSAREQENSSEPEKMIRVDKVEDVVIRGTIQKKVSVFSVAFRLVNPFTSSVIFADSLTEKLAYEGVSAEGLELGEFKFSSQGANLPAGSEMLENLAGRVAETIGGRLVQELEQPEIKYDRVANLAVEEEKFAAAVKNYASAAALAESKGKNAEEYIEKLRVFVFRADK